MTRITKTPPSRKNSPLLKRALSKNKRKRRREGAARGSTTSSTSGLPTAEFRNTEIF